MSSVGASFQQVQRRQYISSAPFFNNFFSYSTYVDATLTVRGSLVVHPSANSSTCGIGHILRENGKKLHFGTHPDLNDPNNSSVSYTYLIGVYDAQTFLSGYIEPNCPLFAPFNTDKSYQNELVNEAVDASTGLTDEGPPVYTRGDITTTNGNILASTGNVTADVNVVAGSNVTAVEGNVSATLGDVTAGRNMVAASNITATAGDVTITAGRLILNAGNSGVAQLSTGSNVGGFKKLTVSSSNCRTTSQVFLTYAGQNNSGVLSSEALANGSFQIVSSTSNDAGSVRWMVIN